MKILGILVGLISFILLLLSWYFIYKPQDIIQNKNVYWSNEWKAKKGKDTVEKQTVFSGSELDFGFKKVNSFTLKATTTNTDNDTGVEIYLDKKSSFISMKKLKNGYTIAGIHDNNQHTFRMIFYCRGWFAPCNFILKQLSITGGSIFKKNFADKTIGILGDSISLLYARNNYSSRLAQNIGYHLHNASIWGRSLSHTGKIAPAVDLVSTQLISYKPDIVFIFLGTNDILDNVTENDFTIDFSLIINRLQNSLPDSKIVVLSILPGETHQLISTATRWNKDIQELLPKRAYYIDATKLLKSSDYLDAIHPDPEGQKKLAEFIENYFIKQGLIQNGN